MTETDNNAGKSGKARPAADEKAIRKQTIERAKRIQAARKAEAAKKAADEKKALKLKKEEAKKPVVGSAKKTANVSVNPVPEKTEEKIIKQEKAMIAEEKKKNPNLLILPLLPENIRHY